MTQNNPNQPDNNPFFQRELPDASSAQTLGILSIIFCGLIGMILAIISLSKVKECQRLLSENPGSYTANSISKMKTGKVCSIISLSLLGAVIFFVIVFAMVGAMS
ncbi:MAG: hypothetical protein ACJ77K_13715 [Bacteroidia bacterium]